MGNKDNVQLGENKYNRHMIGWPYIERLRIFLQYFIQES